MDRFNSNEAAPKSRTQKPPLFAWAQKGTKWVHSMRVRLDRAHVSCVFPGNKSATTASCALRFSVVTACVYVSSVTRIVE